METQFKQFIQAYEANYVTREGELVGAAVLLTKAGRAAISAQRS